MLDMIYYAVFFEENNCVGWKRVNYFKWCNLTDGHSETKTVSLEEEAYTIQSFKTYHIQHSTENAMHGIFEVKKQTT